MQTRTFGNSGLEVSAIGLGCMVVIATKFGWRGASPVGSIKVQDARYTEAAERMTGEAPSVTSDAG